jgi:hypothetical protein
MGQQNQWDRPAHNLQHNGVTVTSEAVNQQQSTDQTQRRIQQRIVYEQA